MPLTLQSRIKERMKALGITNAQLAAACKVKPPTSFNWGSGKTKSIKGEPLLLAAKTLGVTPEWLATGKGPMDRLNKSSQHLVEEVSVGFNYAKYSIEQSLDALESALTMLDMNGRERIAPLFESFARSPGTVIKNDIASFLKNPSNNKSHSTSEAHLQKTG
jgi:transcriptional regulator with XRE-family HTH domain